MPEKSDGGPAFPVAILQEQSSYAWNGMSLRDYFAIHFAEGLARYAAWSDDKTNEQNCRLVTTAYSLADAMLAERTK